MALLQVPAARKRKREESVPDPRKRAYYSPDPEEVSRALGALTMEEEKVSPASAAAMLNSLLTGDAAKFYRFPPAGRKDLWKLVKAASWKELVDMAPLSDIWKLKKRYYKLKKLGRIRRYRRRNYGIASKAAKIAMARARPFRRFRYRSRRFGFRGVRSRWR